VKSEFVIAYDKRHKKHVARRSVDMDGRCPTRSLNDMCVNSVCIVMTAVVQKNDRLARLTADWHEEYFAGRKLWCANLHKSDERNIQS